MPPGVKTRCRRCSRIIINVTPAELLRVYRGRCPFCRLYPDGLLKKVRAYKARRGYVLKGDRK